METERNGLSRLVVRMPEVMLIIFIPVTGACGNV